MAQQEIIQDKHGVVIPEHRIIVYNGLLKQLKRLKRRKDDNSFMCNVVNLMFGFYPNLNNFDGEKSSLPELRRFRPRIGRIRQAWWEGEKYNERIAAVQGAIKLWNAKYAK